MDITFVSSPNSCVESLTSGGMDLGGGSLGRWWSAWEKKRMYRIKKKVFPPSLLAKGLKNLQWQRMGEVWTPHYPGATAETDGGGPNTTLPRSYSWKTFSCVCACGCVCVYMSVNLCRCHTPLLPSVARCLWESSDRPLSLLKQSNLITIFGVQGVYLAEI